MKLFNRKRERGSVIQNVRVIVDYHVAPSDMHVSRSNQGGVEAFQWIDQMESQVEDILYVDSGALRDAFFKVKTPAQAETFLKASGPFRSDSIGVTWPMFQEWQKYFKKQRGLGAAVGEGWGAPPEYLEADHDIVDRIVRVPKLEPMMGITGSPTLAAIAQSTVECIAACNFIERWSKTVILACRQCGDPFAPRTKASIFCGHACAHTHWRANGSTAGRRKLAGKAAGTRVVRPKSAEQKQSLKR